MNNEFWYSSHNRGLETVAVWQTFDGSFKVGELTLAAHTANVKLLYTHIHECNVAQDAVNLVRSDRDAVAAELRDVCGRALAVIGGTLPAGDSMRAQVRSVNAVRGQSQEAMLSKCNRLVSLWLNVNTHRAAMSPAQPPLVVGTVDVEQFQSTSDDFGQVLQDVEIKLAALSRAKSQLRATATKVDTDNKRWFSSWKGHFASGSPERDALSQITTSSSAAPALPGQGVFLAVEPLANQVVRLTFDAARASHFKLWHKGPGAADFSVLAEGLTARTFQHAAQTAGGHAYKVVGSNSAGAGAESVPAVVTVAQQLAA